MEILAEIKITNKKWRYHDDRNEASRKGRI